MERRLAAILVADVVGYGRHSRTDEEKTRLRFNKDLQEFIEPAIARHSGRLVKTMGDGILAEFKSVVDAMRCAMDWQIHKAREAALPSQTDPLIFRIGVNIGDIIAEPPDIHGDGVNIAARLQALAEPGGIAISGATYDEVHFKLPFDFKFVGSRRLKNIPVRTRIYKVIINPSDVAAEPANAAVVEAAHPGPINGDREIHFCKARDGIRLAYAVSGRGPPIVRAAHWMSHLQHDWDSPIWSHWINALSANNTFVRYDERCNGLSSWEADDISFDAMVSDLENVVEAARLSRFTLLGISQGCPISIAYAVRHPERVSGLVLYGGYEKGWRARGNPQEMATREALAVLMREGWGKSNPIFRQLFASIFIKGAGPKHFAWMDELQRRTVSPDNAWRLQNAFADIDVTALLPQISVPTLILHARDDAVAPVESGRTFALEIPGAKFIELDSPNHILMEEEPAFQEFIKHTMAFIEGTWSEKL
jgi:class 3 adenylate cyclase/pimeloyl-ACP methyl ester carboxylesterase